MSLSTRADGTEVHYPAKPEQFEFDADVAPIFPSMAVRSIPNYLSAHRLHAAIAIEHFLPTDASVLDVGASRGGFIEQLLQGYRQRDSLPPKLKIVALDNSESMCRLLRQDYPHIEVRLQDILSPEFMRCRDTYNVINCTYVLQFVAPEHQPLLLQKLYSMLKPNGVLFLGQKDKMVTAVGRMLNQEYIRFRLNNGYTQAEIDAKTRALENSMWPIFHDTLRFHLEKLKFREVIETTRYTVFSTLLCLK